MTKDPCRYCTEPATVIVAVDSGYIRTCDACALRIVKPRRITRIGQR